HRTPPKPQTDRTVSLERALGAGRTAPSRLPSDSTLPPPLGHVSDVEVQEHYDNFFEEVFTELQEKYGEIEEMNVCDNLGDHLVGNVYVKFRREEDAERAVAELNNRWFNGQAVHAELSPVTDFRESCCRQYEMGECTRGGFCNFMHLRPISRNLRRQLYGHPRDPILATVPEKETDDVLQTTGMAASETLAPLPFIPDRHGLRQRRCGRKSCGHGPPGRKSCPDGPFSFLPTAALFLAQAAQLEASLPCGHLEYWNPDNQCCGGCLQRFGPPPAR
ncbi:hypothetical protein MC885_019566, partial [Smutsia gigantea]